MSDFKIVKLIDSIDVSNAFSDAEGNPATIGTTAVGTSVYGARRDHVHAGNHIALSSIGTNTHAQIDTFIDTTVPGTYLTISSASTIYLTISSASTTYLALAGGIMVGNIITPSIFYIGSTSTTGISLSAGNVGIGTTSPTQKLDIAGDFVVDTAGHWVGIGTTSPGRKLDISGSGDWESSIRTTRTSNNNTVILGSRYVGSMSNNSFGIYANSTEKMTILAAGNVGIGTTGPTAVLHLKAGTAAVSTSPLKLTAGVLNTTPEAGAIEFDGTNLYFTNAAGTRSTIAVA